MHEHQHQHPKFHSFIQICGFITLWFQCNIVYNKCLSFACSMLFCKLNKCLFSIICGSHQVTSSDSLTFHYSTTAFISTCHCVFYIHVACLPLSNATYKSIITCENMVIILLKNYISSTIKYP